MPKSGPLAKRLVKVCFQNFALQAGSNRRSEFERVFLTARRWSFSFRFKDQEDKSNGKPNGNRS